MFTHSYIMILLSHNIQVPPWFTHLHPIIYDPSTLLHLSLSTQPDSYLHPPPPLLSSIIRLSLHPALHAPRNIHTTPPPSVCTPHHTNTALPTSPPQPAISYPPFHPFLSHTHTRYTNFFTPRPVHNHIPIHLFLSTHASAPPTYSPHPLLLLTHFFSSSPKDVSEGNAKCHRSFCDSGGNCVDGRMRQQTSRGPC